MNQVNHKNRIIELYWLLFLDLITIAVSYTGAHYVAISLRFQISFLEGFSNLHFTICLCLMLFSTVYCLLLDWNRSFLKRGYFVEGVVVLKYNIIMVVVVGCFLFLTQQAEFFSRLLFGFFFVNNVILTWLVHVVFKKILRRYLRSEHSRTRIVLIAETGNIEETILSLQEKLAVNYEISSLVLLDEDKQGESCLDIPIVANKSNLMEVAKQLPVDEVFIRVNSLSIDVAREMIQDFESMGVTCHYSIDIADWNSKESSIGKFGKFTVISYSIYNMDYRRLMIKRAMDVVGGLIGILLTAIVTPFIALAIKMESKGPVFFSQVRIGKNGRRFRIYKFRSMYIDAEERKKELQAKNEIRGLMFKIKDDPRITKVGRFLRKTSLDELPQFYNILTGDMSLVGTRPPTVDEFEQYSLYYRRRLCMTPGLTGLWQVSGRSDVENFDDVVKFDLEYIDNWSLSMDLKILLQTIWVVFVGRGSK